MKRFSLLVLFIFSTHLVFALSKTETRLSGRILNLADDRVEIRFTDNFITFAEKSILVPMDANGFFEITLYFSEPKEILLQFGFRSYRIFLEPGDDQFLRLDSKMVNAVPIFEGRGASNNNYFSGYQNQFRNYTDAYVRSQMASLEPQAFKDFINKIRKEKLNYFSANSGGLTALSQAHAHADIDYWWGYQLLQYRWEHPPKGDEPFPLQLDNIFYSFLDELDIYWEAAISNVMYAYFVTEFLSFEEERDKQSSLEDFIPRPYKNARKYLSGKPLAYAIANEMYLLLKRNQHHLYVQEIKDFIRDTPYDDYRQVVSEAFEQSQVLLPGQPAPDFTVVDKKGNEVHLSDFRGKVVYLDFWASWCPPCVKELPHSKQLRNSFQTDEVVFLYISLDINAYIWKEYLKNNRLLSGHHYFAKGVYDSDMARDYYLKALPYFLLIDQQGFVVKSPAPRPSDKTTRATIEQLLLSGR